MALSSWNPKLEHNVEPVGDRIADLRVSPFAGGGEMGALMRALDWSQTAIGPVSKWPQSLKTAVRIILTSRYAMFVWWGRELVNLYNDPYRAFLGSKHPAALGKSARDVWAEIWDQIGPRAEAVLLRGESTYDESLLLLMERHGYVEETYFTFSYSPLPDDEGEVGGLFCAVTETTQQLIGERRLTLLREIAAEMAECRTPEQVCQSAARCLANALRDLPFSLIYLLDPQGTALHRAGGAGIPTDHPAAPEFVSLETNDESVWPFRRVIESGEPVLIEDLSNRIAAVPKGAWDRASECAILLPIAQQGQTRPAGVFFAGLNPYRKFADEFSGFVSLLANQIAGAIANAVAYETERRRAEALTELDRAKTRFFSNVSHEFRTPLTLMLGPLEEVLSKEREQLSPERHAQLTVVRRNALRLLKLVNTLLDFSRIEAGRVQATYTPTDLAGFTAEIAAVFRSAIETAGLRFSVDCEPMPEPAYVDCDMWEEIVLNLISNAFKFTFQGEVAVTLKHVNGFAELAVSDTGVGIPENELPRVFERFHRIENARSRTYEGTGIGLALVQELAKLHGGNARAESEIGRGSRFVVSIPLGHAHLPADRIQGTQSSAHSGLSARAYVDDAERWLPREPEAAADHGISAQPVPVGSAPAVLTAEKDLVLVADDNADMREYLCHMLRAEYRVHAVSDGPQAVEATRQLRPALVLSDVMMPGIDGFEVLRAIRNDSAISNTPVILLSARAGEESRVEGLQAGADDYLVKPFTARELMARVATHIRMSRLRGEAAQRETRLRKEAELERGRLQELLAKVPAAIAVTSGPDHRWRSVNEAFVATTGRKSASDFLGKTAKESLPEIAGQGVIELLDKVYRSGEPFFGTERLVHLDRSGSGKPTEAYFDFVYQPVRDAEGKTEGILIHAVDVTAQVKARNTLVELSEARHRLAAIVESSDDAIVSKDLNGIVTSWNAGAEKTFGYTPQEIVGKPITTIIPPELHSDEQRILSTIARGDRIDHFETVRVHKSGERINISLTVSPVKDETGRIVGAAKIARDITQQKRAEQALRTTERLASVGRLAATVAHEINNPLEAITNLVYLAKHNATQDDVRGYLSRAEEELERVSHLTKQTLGFYRDTRGATATRVGFLLTGLLTVFGSRLRNKAVDIRPQIKSDPEIIAIQGEIRQVIANLLANSIDAVDDKGTIRVRIASSHDWKTGHTPGVRLTVADTGYGIAPEARRKLFEPFFTTRKDVGTGLGLWVCKNIVEKHQGSICLRSNATPGRSWTVFSVFLPARPNAEEGVLKAAQSGQV